MSTQRIVKHEIVGNFTMIPNDFLLDPSMSGLAKWCVATYWSRPAGWTCTAEWLESVCTDGRQALLTALRLAETCGYLCRVREQDDQGRWVTEIHLSVVPIDFDDMEDIPPLTVNPKNGRSSRTRSAGSRTSVSRTSAHAPLSTNTESKTGSKTTTTPRRGATRRAAAEEEAAAPSRTGMRRSRADDETKEVKDEPQVLGTAKKRKPTAAAIEVAVERGSSGFGMANRLERALKAAGVTVPGGGALVNVSAVATQLNEAHKRGQSWQEQQMMIDSFVESPSRYTSGDQEPWKAFLASRAKLVADADKHRKTQHSSFVSPYANIEEDDQ